MIFKCKKKNRGGRRLGAFLVVLLLAWSMSAFGAYESPHRTGSTYVCTNATGEYADTNISTSTIIPAYCRILGYRIAPYDTTASSEFVVSLWDAADTQTAADMFDEAEWGATGPWDPMWYPLPKKLNTQLTVRQGPNTTVVIYYDDTRKY